MNKTVQAELQDRVNAIEEAYEFFLAYAAQGLPADSKAKTAGELRRQLERCDEALGAVSELFTSFVNEQQVESPDRYHAFIGVLTRDARDAQIAVQLVRSQPGISSQLIDNLNALIHLRALLTDIFLIDESLKPHFAKATVS